MTKRCVFSTRSRKIRVSLRFLAMKKKQKKNKQQIHRKEGRAKSDRGSASLSSSVVATPPPQNNFGVTFWIVDNICTNYTRTRRTHRAHHCEKRIASATECGAERAQSTGQLADLQSSIGMDGSPRGIAWCPLRAHTNTRKIIIIMMNDATMRPMPDRKSNSRCHYVVTQCVHSSVVSSRSSLSVFASILSYLLLFFYWSSVLSCCTETSVRSAPRICTVP